MAIEVKINNVSIQYPQIGDTEWGNNATNFAIQTATAFNAIGLSDGTTVDLPGTLDVTGNTTLDANLSVGGTTSLTGNVTLTNNLTVNGNETVGGTLGVTGDVAINTNKFNVTASSGNTTIAGTLGISNGSASAPSLTPSGDTNTGIYSIGSDIMGFAANGSRVGEFGSGYGGFTGNVIQLQNSTNTFNQNNTTTGSYSDVNSASSTPWEITITPRYTNSKIIIFYVINFTVYGPVLAGSAYAGFRIDRKIGAGAYSNIYENQRDANGAYNFGTNSSVASTLSIFANAILMYVDSPNTTSTCTYKLLSMPYNTGHGIVINVSASNINGKSYVTVQEVQQ